jgi:hypothetical protein
VTCLSIIVTRAISQRLTPCGAAAFAEFSPKSSDRLSPPTLGRFDGGIVCFWVYLEQFALELKLTKPVLQLLVVHVLKGIKKLLASHRLMLLYPGQQCDAFAGLGLVTSTVYGNTNRPVGRSAPVGLLFCDSECPGIAPGAAGVVYSDFRSVRPNRVKERDTTEHIERRLVRVTSFLGHTVLLFYSPKP